MQDLDSVDPIFLMAKCYQKYWMSMAFCTWQVWKTDVFCNRGQGQSESRRMSSKNGIVRHLDAEIYNQIMEVYRVSCQSKQYGISASSSERGMNTSFQH